MLSAFRSVPFSPSRPSRVPPSPSFPSPPFPSSRALSFPSPPALAFPITSQSANRKYILHVRDQQMKNYLRVLFPPPSLWASKKKLCRACLSAAPCPCWASPPVADHPSCDHAIDHSNPREFSHVTFSSSSFSSALVSSEDFAGTGEGATI
jgi:hypothetical protein